MNTKGILRPDELPFQVPEQLAYDINELIKAWDRNEQLNLDCYMNEVQCSARMVSEENDAWIRKYYLQGGWRKDVETPT